MSVDDEKFDSSDAVPIPDLTKTVIEKTPVLIDHDKRIAKLEALVEEQRHEILHLRKLMRVWVEGR